MRTLLALFAVTALALAQTTWYVSPTGTGTGTSAASPLGSIQSAINSAANGDIIQLAAGTYTGSQFYNNTISGKSLTIRGDSLAPTIIDGALADARFIFANSASTFTMQQVTVENFRPSNYGGSVRIESISPSIEDCVIRNNASPSGGVGIRFNNCPSGKIVRCTFTNNDVIPFGNDQGGGILFYNCGSPSQKFEVSSSNFHDNSAANGGGIFAQYSWADVRQCTFNGNSAYGSGGGLFWNASSSINCQDCVFENNHAVNSRGGGAFGEAEPTTIDRCTFRNNSAPYGGGLYLNSNANVSSCEFDQNTANQQGGGAYLIGSSNYYGWLRNCVFRRNSANYGGGLYRDYGYPGAVAQNCTFVGNTANYSGSGVFANQGCYQLINCIVYGNRVNGSDASQTSGSCILPYYSIFETLANQSIYLGYGESTIATGLPLDGSTYHLPAGSGAINYGMTPHLGTDWRDIDGQTRVIGGGVDCGADEYGPMEILASNVANIGSGWVMNVRTYPPLPYTPYAVDLSVTGTTPGIQLAPGQSAPLNPPLLNYDYGIYLSNPYPNIFQNFIGLTDASGRADAIFNVPDLPALIGLNVWGAGCVLDATSTTGIGPISAPVQTLVKDHLPAITSVTPNTAPEGGNAPITLIGDFFQPGATVTVGGTPATNVVVVSPNQLTFLANAHSQGVVDIVVTNPDTQVVTLTGAFTYLPNLSLGSITPYVPSSGETVTVTGQGFQSACSLNVGGVTVTPATVTPTQVTFVMPSGSSCGGAFTMTNPSTQTGTLPFNPPPTVSSISNNVGQASGGQTFDIYGSNFYAGSTVTVGGAPAVINGLSTSSIQAVAPAGTPGTASVVVTSAYGCTSTGSFYYLGAAPTVTGVTLNQGPIAGGTAITVIGTNFLNAPQVKIGGNSCTNVVVVNAQTITCTTPAGTLGAKDVLLVNGDTQTTTLAGGFTYIPNLVINSVTYPSMAPGATVTVAGAGFLAGLSMTACGVSVTPITQTATSLTFSMPSGLACTGQLVIVNPTGQTSSVLFNPSPIVVGLVLANGPLQGGNNFVIQGRWFYPGTTVTVGGTNATIVSMTPGTATTLGSIVVAAPSSATSGPKPVVVTSPTGCVNTGALNYTYN